VRAAAVTAPGERVGKAAMMRLMILSRPS